MSKQKIYFISGHRDISTIEFEKYYVPALHEALSEGNSKFVVAECSGVDSMAQDWLSSNLSDTGKATRVTVYHMMTKPRYLASELFKTVGGFVSDIERDAEMTKSSDVDIAFIRPGRWTSGTAQNILRRYERIV